jgi:hypothetical protein
MMKPGETLEYPATGQFVRVDNGSLVHVKSDLGQVAPLYERDSAQLNRFSLLSITNKSAQEELISVRVSDGPIVSAGDGAVMAISPQGNGVTIENPQDILSGATVTAQIDSVGINGEVEIKNDATTITDKPDIEILAGNSAVIVAANPNRKEVMIQADSANDAQVSTARVGAETVNQGRGAKLFAGGGNVGQLSLPTSGVVRVHNEGPDAIKISVLEVLK